MHRLMRDARQAATARGHVLSTFASRSEWSSGRLTASAACVVPSCTAEAFIDTRPAPNGEERG
jgi:hypothetical protein